MPAQGQVKTGAQPAQRGFQQLKASAIQVGQVVDDGQAQAGAGYAFVAPYAALQQERFLIGLDALTIVIDFDAQSVVSAGRTNEDPRGGPFAGIVEQVAEHFLNVLRFTLKDQLIGTFA